jgi:hypothetical protein
MKRLRIASGRSSAHKTYMKRQADGLPMSALVDVVGDPSREQGWLSTGSQDFIILSTARRNSGLAGTAARRARNHCQ